MSEFINAIFGSVMSLDPVSAIKMLVMWVVGGVLIYLPSKRTWSPACCCRWASAPFW